LLGTQKTIMSLFYLGRIVAQKTIMSLFYLGRIDEVEYQIQKYSLSFNNFILFQEHNLYAYIF